ncbi:MAG: thioredoxin-dependent thiol peroxidase [Flavobacteriales bacterium]
MLQKGDRVPDFAGVTQDNKPITSKDYEGKKYVVFFYPRASTPGCTTEACNLRDHHEALKAQGYHIIGVSADSVVKQKKWAEKHTLLFPLIADEEKTIINAFGVWKPKKFMGKEYEGIHRTTFIVNEKGLVDKVITKVKTKDHAAQILE